jgi:hypothetical protein
VEFQQLALREIRVQLNLVDGWKKAGLVLQLLQELDREVGDAEGARTRLWL